MKQPTRSVEFTNQPPPQERNKYGGKTDQEIWSAFKKGDEVAFNYIYLHYTEPLFNFGYQLAKNEFLVKDCVQNLFIDLRRRRSNLSEVISIKSYLYKGLYRELIKRLEKERKFVGDMPPENGDNFHIEISVEAKLIKQELDEGSQKILQIALNSLTVKQRKALLLFYAENMTYKEIAEVFEMSEVKSARKLVYRAIESAQKELKTRNIPNPFWIIAFPILAGTTFVQSMFQHSSWF